MGATSNLFFTDRIAVLATMHGKEQAIAPILQQELAIQVVVPAGLDTNQFGTFTRERERSGTQREAARLKARMALELTGTSLAIASEGSFAPHPSFPAIACNRELVLLLDLEHGLEVVGQELSFETNFSHQTIRTIQEANTFAQKVGFPENGLVVMTHRSALQEEEIFKGIRTEAQLIAAVDAAMGRSPDGTIHLETDMRAMHNPSRMKVIATATRDLVVAVRRTCPKCGCPGLELVEQKRGLPCALCHLPTDLIRASIYRCQKCQAHQEIPFPNGITTADPGQCAYCNP
jgi:hypothetical protein